MTRIKNKGERAEIIVRDILNERMPLCQEGKVVWEQLQHETSHKNLPGVKGLRYKQARFLDVDLYGRVLNERTGNLNRTYCEEGLGISVKSGFITWDQMVNIDFRMLSGYTQESYAKGPWLHKENTATLLSQMKAGSKGLQKALGYLPDYFAILTDYDRELLLFNLPTLQEDLKKVSDANPGLIKVGDWRPYTDGYDSRIQNKLKGVHVPFDILQDLSIGQYTLTREEVTEFYKKYPIQR